MSKNKLQEVLIAAKEVIENWESGDLAGAVRRLDSITRDFDGGEIDELINCLEISIGIIQWASDHGADRIVIASIERKIRKALKKIQA